MTNVRTPGRRLAPLMIVLAFVLGACGHRQDATLFTELLKMAERGDREAQYHLGMLFNNGIGTDQDPAKAFAWFRRSADAGDPLASYKVGCYYGGQFRNVVPVDQDRARAYKLVAANAGYALAQYEIGLGHYAQKRFDDAVHWWKQAADQGDPMALHTLSVIYRKGEIVPTDKVRAYSYLTLANLASGQSAKPDARASLDGLKTELSVEELQAGERIVAAWRPKPSALTIKASAGIGAAMQLAGIDAK